MFPLTVFSWNCRCNYIDAFLPALPFQAVKARVSLAKTGQHVARVSEVNQTYDCPFILLGNTPE